MLRVFSSILALALLLAAPASAELAPERRCELGYSLFAGPGYDKEGRLRARHAYFRGINAADNKNFLKLARAAADGEPGPAKLFLFSENAVLKELNDTVVGDKDFVNPLVNLRKDLEHFHLEKDPALGGHVLGTYSDFKVHQLALDVDSPAVRGQLRTTMSRVQERYGNYLDSIAEPRAWASRGRGWAQDRRGWFHAGIGASAEEAALAARVSRTVPAGQEGPRLWAFAEAEPYLARAARRVQHYNRWLEKRFARVPRFLSPAGGGRAVLSAEVIDVIRKLKPARPTAESYREALREALLANFDVKINAKEADALKAYLGQADYFSLPLLLDERVEVDLGRAVSGVASADFRGQGARNLEETLRALSRSEGQPLAQRVREVRRGEKRATMRLDALKARYRRVFQSVVPDAEVQFSGDDGIAFLSRPLSEQEKLRFARAWRKAGGKAGDLRLTFEDFTYADTGAAVPAKNRAALIGVAEGLEKRLQEKLFKRLGRQAFADAQVLVTLEAREKGPAHAHVRLLTPRVGESLQAAVKEIVEGEGLTLGSFDRYIH